AILHVGGDFDVVRLGFSVWGEGREASTRGRRDRKAGLIGRQDLTFAQECNTAPVKDRVIGQPIEIDAEGQLMLPTPLCGRKVKMGYSLETPRTGVGEQVKVSCRAIGRNDVGFASEWNLFRSITVESETEFEEFASREVMLVLNAHNIGRQPGDRRRVSRV